MRQDEIVVKTDEEACELLCAAINDFLQSRFGYKKRHAYVHPPRIVARTSKLDLYFRYRAEPDTITIARIGFTAKQRGHGTALLKVILGLSDVLHIRRVVIEQAGPEGEAFARAFGFSQYYNDRNWEISVLDLRNALERRDAVLHG